MSSENKIVAQDALAHQAQEWRRDGLTVVFTNGCFDILHRGHVDYLEQAKALGDKLVVAINSDASTRRLKGAHRPLNDQDARTRVMAALACVDLVTIFDEDTPEALITMLSPDVLVKGGDYSADDVVGGSHVRATGGKVVILPFTAGYSTSGIESRILALYANDESKPS